jgi:thiol-disulfide isomerase/thioredoxin
MKKLGLIVLFVVFIFASTTYAKPKSSQMLLTAFDGTILELDITDGGFTFPQYSEKTVMLNFFGPMCPPCMIKMPQLNELQEDYTKDIQIISVQVQLDMSDEELGDFIKTNNIKHPVINLNNAWDIVTFVRANTDWQGEIPYMMMFGKNGNRKETYIGVVSNEKILRDMK